MPLFNVTITVPEELKERMDKFAKGRPETNWSLIARRAFDQYIEAQKGPIPRVSIMLDDTRFSFHSQLGPVLETRLYFENRMPTDIVIDRYAITQTIFTGNDLFIASRQTSWNMTPIRIPQALQVVIPDYFAMRPQDVLGVDHLVKSTLTIKTTIEAYAAGFNEPVRAEVIDRLPAELWKDFVNGVKHFAPLYANQSETNVETQSRS